MADDIDRLLKKWAPALGRNPSAGNLVHPFYHGAEALAAMNLAIQTAQNRSHFIYLLGWFLDYDKLQLDIHDPDSTVPKLFLKKASEGVQIRLMLWALAGGKPDVELIRQTSGLAAAIDPQLGLLDPLLAKYDRRVGNNAIKERIESLPNQRSAVILDVLTASIVGSHHQKMLVVKGTSGLVAFVGGVDINPDRTQVLKPNVGQPLHDVHCAVLGPAAKDLLDIFVKRWTSHPEHVAIDKKRGSLIGLHEPRPAKPAGSAYVRTVSTFNKVEVATFDSDVAPTATRVPLDGLPDDLRIRRSGCCQVDRTVRDSLRAAIGAAKEFIYFECQYMVGMDTAEALRAALPHVQHIIVLITSGAISDMPRIWEKRKKFINRVQDTKVGQEKFRVFYLADASPVRRALIAPRGVTKIVRAQEDRYGPETYVHAKTWVFDDEVAFIGSPNVNNRGWSSDSEVGVLILDKPPAVGRPSFARTLRKKLWATHLGVPETAVENGCESATLWEQDRDTSRVRPYNPYAGVDSPESRLLSWNLLDPWMDDLPKCGAK
jgi:phosphatidylserine/phosphatidylglycerophosphate/cardiolipin synthase-like enzyme